LFRLPIPSPIAANTAIRQPHGTNCCLGCCVACITNTSLEEVYTYAQLPVQEKLPEAMAFKYLLDHNWYPSYFLPQDDFLPHLTINQTLIGQVAILIVKKGLGNHAVVWLQDCIYDPHFGITTDYDSYKVLAIWVVAYGE
jgi:hypothetical protein